jgi:YD repeat-containing protein
LEIDTYYNYDAGGNLVSTLHPNGILDTRTYDASGRLNSVEGKKSDESPFCSCAYTYDPVGVPAARSRRWYRRSSGSPTCSPC